jgi:hypothetical protein
MHQHVDSGVIERFFVQNRPTRDKTDAYEILIETIERPFLPAHFNAYIVTAPPESYFTT